MKIDRLFLSCAVLVFLNVAPCFGQTPRTEVEPSIPSPTLAAPDQKDTQGLHRRTERELRNLERVSQERDLQDAVLKWAQGRFWMIALIGLFIGFFGVRALVRELIAGELKEAMRVIAAAEAASNQAREATKRVQSEAEDYQSAVERLRKTAADVQSDLSSLRSLIEAEATNARKAAEIGLGGMQRQLDALSGNVAELLSGGSGSTDVVARQSEIKEKSVAEQHQFARRSKYRVAIFGDEGCRHLADALSAKGYKASLNPTDFVGIPENTLLYARGTKPVLDEVVQLIEEHTGSQPDRRSLPFKGISGRTADIYVFLQASSPDVPTAVE